MNNNAQKKDDKKCAMCSVDESVFNQIKEAAVLDDKGNEQKEKKEKSGLLSRFADLFKRKSV